jgi:hypothetical protein
MNRKTGIILSLLSAALSLIYVIFSYYGIVRYLGLYIWPTEGYARDYKKLDSVSENRVVIAIAEDASLLKSIGPTVRSLLDQTVRVDAITMVIPAGESYTVPEDLKGVVSILKCGVDRGCVMNSIIPTLSREPDAGTKVIIIQGGVIYGKTYIEDVLEYSKTLKGESRHINAGSGFLIEVDDIDPIALEAKCDEVEWKEKYVKSTNVLNYTENWGAL